MTNNVNYVEIWTDGACKGNPGIGGWGVVIKWPDGREDNIYGGESKTTNNRMELLAVINGLKKLGNSSYMDIAIYTDSKYVMNGITNWINSWKHKGWKLSNGKDVKNKDLWESLDELSGNYNINWNWVKGHSDNYGNNKADRLANMGVETI
ncbi:MAG: ribonuclease HI [Candidatus Kinetoplastibacterium crithidii]|nr:MAG: ribonuclease HI [Candidatus Kinetoplastibacterium crithidii]